MTASELIKRLEQLKQEIGDVPVVLPQTSFSNFERKWLAQITEVEIGNPTWFEYGNTYQKIVIW
jgi:hypothetical protein